MNQLFSILVLIAVSNNLFGQDINFDVKLDSLKMISIELKNELKPIQDKLNSVNEEIKILTLQQKTPNKKNVESNGIATKTSGGETELYEKHDYQSKSLISIPNNSTIKVFEKYDFFLKVEFNGIVGWVNEGWISTNDEINKLQDKKPDYSSPSTSSGTKPNAPISKTLNLRSYASVHKHPSEESLEIKSFAKENVTLIGYVNGMFKVKSQSDLIGYTPFGDIEYNKAKYFKLLLENELSSKVKFDRRHIYIKGAGVTKINYANGVDFAIDWGYFNSEKEIKYIDFYVKPYNKVGDVQRCSITGASTFKGQLTGPISASDKFDRRVWRTAWYNKTISCIKITKITVKYLDGSNYTYVKELPKIMDSDYVNNCGY